MRCDRFYRQFHKGTNLTYFNVKLEQTDLEIGALKILYKEAMVLVKKYRKDIEEYIKENPSFLYSLKPLTCRPDAPLIVKKMCSAAEKAGVGPMAAVAGAISEFVGRGLLEFSKEVIVENGGDVFIKSECDRVIGIYAGKSPLSQKIGLRISATATPLGVCTSAGTVGHSLSFGRADAVVILSCDVALADAVATATGNIIKGPEDIEKGLRFAARIEGVKGAVVIVNDRIGAWGKVSLTRV